VDCVGCMIAHPSCPTPPDNRNSIGFQGELPLPVSQPPFPMARRRHPVRRSTPLLTKRSVEKEGTDVTILYERFNDLLTCLMNPPGANGF